MKRGFVLLLLMAVSGACLRGEEKPQGASSLTVRVFSTRRLSSLTITPLGRSEWIRTCESCQRKTVSSPFTATVESGSIVLSSGTRLQATELGGAFHMQAAGAASEITAAGVWKLIAGRGEMRVLLTLDSERYVAFALNGEAAPNEPLESLKAMAVTIRTYELENAKRHASEGFDLCDSTHCQALRFGRIPPQVEEAVLETAGETLWYRGHRASVFYTQNCGGETEAASNIWPQLHVPYLTEHRDPYCSRRALSQWHAELPVAEMQKISRNEGWRLPPRIEAVRILKRTAAGRAQELEFSGDGVRVPVSATSLRFAIDRSLGWNQLRSDWYSVTLSDGALHFNGRGYGHGVGLCQAGTLQMAAEGHSYREILNFYFPGTSVGITPLDHGWQQTQYPSWTLWTVAPSLSLLKEGDAAWGDAKTLFHPRTPVQPIVRVFPTTELFRQSTGEPGWILASAQDAQIFLQPETVLQKNGKERGTMLHEFLHVMVEREASPQAPLWLREGLVEALAERSARRPSEFVEIGSLNAALAHPPNEAESQHAHAAAALLTRALISRYGLEQVRQWLHTGSVPDAALRGLPQVPQQQPEHSRSMLQ